MPSVIFTEGISLQYIKIDMKKVLFLGAFALLGFVANAQTSGKFKIGANVGIPVGDISNGTSFTIGADAAYQWRIAQNFDLGIASGYQHFFAKEFTYNGHNLKGSDFGYIPLAASAQYSVTPNFFIGADLGYGFVVNTSSDGGGFYYQPKVGYQQDKFEVYLGYKGVSDMGTISSVNLGFNFKL